MIMKFDRQLTYQEIHANGDELASIEEKGLEATNRDGYDFWHAIQLFEFSVDR